MAMKSNLIVASLLALLMGVTCVVPDAEARRVAGSVHARPHVNAHNVAHNIRPHYPARAAARNVYSAGRWVNGVWIVNGVAASVAVGAGSNCNYYYRNWKATGRAYWRDRYHEACG